MTTFAVTLIVYIGLATISIACGFVAGYITGTDRERSRARQQNQACKHHE